MKEPSDLLANLLFALSSGFLALLVIGVCQQAARTRAAMETAVAAAEMRARPPRSSAGVQPVLTPGAPCVPGQIHSCQPPERSASASVLFTTAP